MTEPRDLERSFPKRSEKSPPPITHPLPISRDLSPSTTRPHAPAPLALPLHLLEAQLQAAQNFLKQSHPPQPHSQNQPPHSQNQPPPSNALLHNNFQLGAAHLAACSVTPVSLSGDARSRTQSVSFCDSDPLERSRRFTILAQPLAVNLGQQRGLAVNLPQGLSRKSSLYDSMPLGSRNSLALGMNLLPLHHPPQHTSLASHGTSRVELPVSEPQAFSFDRPSPLPPLKGKLSPITSPKASAAGVFPEHPVVSVEAVPIRQTSVLRSNSTKKSHKTVVASPVGPPVPFQQYLTKEDDRKFHILLACTGSVATIKVPMIIDKLFQTFGTSKISVQLVVTKAAGHFLKGLKIHNDVKIWRDEDEWANFTEWNASNTTTASTSEHSVKKPKNPYEKMILHNELRKWADIMLIAPLSANTLAKIAHGISDNLLTSIVRCWGPSPAGQGTTVKKPIYVAPAMNTFMYTHPMTAKQLKMLTVPEEGFGFEVLKPVEKVLVCGDIGMGGMREWLDIVEILRRKIKAIITERSASLAVPSENDEDERNEDGDDGENDDDYDDDDDEDDEEDDDEGDHEETADGETVDSETPSKKNDLMFELSDDTQDLASKIQRTISPVTEEALSII